ncbi:ABC transporter substrate-binding protein, partial [Burkholderia cenocepacia]|uniref:ABC transporter substrate-binding protein n=1 Tax=Burkholderia cenocepacia TaxID=95486 RepID=UPI0009D1F653
EQDEILADIGSLGTPTNSSIQKYLNSKKIPHLLISTGASKWNDPKEFPWTTPFYPPYAQEAKIYGKYILKELPSAKIGVIYQNDDFGKDYLRGFKEALGDKAGLIVKELSYEVTDPTIDSQIVNLKAAGADVLMTITTPKFGAQTINKTAELGWKPLQIITNVSASVGSVMQPAGFDNAQGVLSAAYAKDGADPQWANDPNMKKWAEFLDKYMPGADKTDGGYVYGYGAAQTLAKVLEMCGDDLTRANVMKQAASLKDFTPDTLLPGVKINTSATDFAPIAQLQMQRFKGQKWELFGEIISGDVPSE